LGQDSELSKLSVIVLTWVWAAISYSCVVLKTHQEPTDAGVNTSLLEIKVFIMHLV